MNSIRERRQCSRKATRHGMRLACTVIVTASVLIGTGTALAVERQAAAAASDGGADSKPGKQQKTASSFHPPVCTGELHHETALSVAEGKSRVIDLQQLKLPSPAWLRAVGDPEVVQLEPLVSSAPRNMFFVFGKQVGATNLMFQNKEGRCAVVEVSVGIDTAAVRASLQALLPDEKNVTVSAAADSLILGGMVSGPGAVDRIMTVARAFVRKQGAQDTGAGRDRVINMMTVGAPQQVMLEVKVAEISRTLLDSLGVGISAASSKGGWTMGLLSKFAGGGNGGLRLEKGNDLLQIEAEKKNGLVKILAEPTVMAISGQDGSFLAGGRIFIPVAQDANGKVTLEEKEFGVGLRFTPTVLDGGRINLKVAPEVSELSREGVGIASSGLGGNAVLPLITTRRAATTVQLFDGQSFAIGGLIKNNVTESIKAFPVLGEVPMLGALFRSSDFQSDKTELVFIVTPRLVKPLPAEYPLPTDYFSEPGRDEFFLHGRMEGALPIRPSAQVAARGADTGAPATGVELK
ncbi:MAG TPA: type II and III secretion system protein family protein [Noviherbaspirillum sp.]|jgi:pilus assembly protein CpaC|uniref:type II and III secretion system protein family protein n=1 Tax=Noviherbaspirillum sp. TaxID=1926288 RepID=UPI002F93AA82